MRRLFCNANTAVSLMLAAVFFFSCTDALVQPFSTAAENADDRLTVKGRVCSPAADPAGFPVKVVFIVDESGSMCVSDPPGSQEGNGFCDRADIQAIIPPGVTQPARVRALSQLVRQFAGQPNVTVAVVPFETNVKNPWPPASTGQRFARPDATLDAFIRNLQNQLGKGTDYQGVLSYVYSLISSDIAATATLDPARLPRTRYVVVFLTDGTPYPRCTANKNLPQYAGPANPWDTWNDSPGLGGPQGFCNLLPTDPADIIRGYIPGTDRNQNYQIFSYVDNLMALKRQYNVADIRLHTVLLLNVAAVRACGPICQDLYGAYDGVAPQDYPEATHIVAKWLLTQLAQRGNGIFQEFLDGSIQSLGLGALDYSSLFSRNVMKSLIVRGMSATAGKYNFELDTDGDGVTDADEFTFRTDKLSSDSEGDCFPDGFEIRHKNEGFDPLIKDPRGCDPASPRTLGCVCRDTDGDGLSQFAEAYLGTNTGLMDTDGDGIPDGLEVRYGFNPLVPDIAGHDTDGDGISDVDELRANSNPIVKDRPFYEQHGYQYQSKVAEVRADGSVCYDFTVSNLQLLTPPPQAGIRQGLNLFKVLFASSPESGVATDNGDWQAGCAWAEYNKPIRVPEGPDVTLTPGNFYAPSDLVSQGDYLTKCVGARP